MISNEVLKKLAIQYQTGVFPNIVREYFQHLFLSEFYKIPEAEKVLFKGGTALRIINGSPRFSEDLDFSVFGVEKHNLKKLVEDLFVKTLLKIEQLGVYVEIGEKSDKTSGGYFGVATFKFLNYQPVGVEINISTRNGQKIKGEIDIIANDFVPTYTLIHLPQDELIEEKVFGALLERKKPRDFYDLYFIMRKGILTIEHKDKLQKVRNEILEEAKKIDFRGELGVFLPVNQQIIIKDFYRTLELELNRQIA